MGFIEQRLLLQPVLVLQRAQRASVTDLKGRNMLKGHRSMSCVSQQLLYTHKCSPHSEFIVEEVIMIQAASHTNEIY